MTTYRKMFVYFEVPIDEEERERWEAVVRSYDPSGFRLDRIEWADASKPARDVYTQLADAFGIDWDPDAPGSILNLCEKILEKHQGEHASPEDGPTGKPRFEVGQRVLRTDEEGRVQQVSYAASVFRYLVKWDNGPTTSHVEGELSAAPLPPHYP